LSDMGTFCIAADPIELARNKSNQLHPQIRRRLREADKNAGWRHVAQKKKVTPSSRFSSVKNCSV
jgi:hypothetical protein